jgi:Uncharacterized protein conserved in bacteria
MPRSILPIEIADLSVFAKQLRAQITALDHAPSHLEMLNLLAKAGGYRNYQHLRAEQSASATPTPETTEPVVAQSAPVPVPDETRVMRTLRVFDSDGRIVRWPGKRSQQELCLWFLWSKIPANRSFTEREIGEFLNTLHLFGDAALLRRDLFDLGLVQRKRDGSDYRRVERKPPAELSLLLSRLGAVKARAA